MAGGAASSRRAAILDRDGTLIDFHRDAELGADAAIIHGVGEARWIDAVVDDLAAAVAHPVG